MSSKIYNACIIGYAHSHVVSNAREFFEITDKVTFIGAADIPPLVEPTNDSYGTRYGIMRDFNAHLGITNVYDDYKKLLDENDVDIAIVCAENAFHADVCPEILRRGIHVVVEKPLSTTIEGARRIVEAAKEGGAKIIVNWPSTWSPAVRAAKKLCDAGEIGRIVKIAYRNSDSEGPLSYGQVMTNAEKGAEWWYQKAAGGGAMLDYCCYGACVSRYIYGEKAISAMAFTANYNSPYGDVEDYAAIIGEYPHGAALIEGSWVTKNTGVPGAIVFGLDGTMVVDRNEIRVYKTRHKADPDAIYTPDPLPVGRENLGAEVIHCLETGDELHPTLDVDINLDAMALLDAGIRSSASGVREAVR